MSETQVETLSDDSLLSGYDPTMAITLAEAVNVAYYKYNNPNWKLAFAGYKILAEIYAFEAGSGGYVFWGFAATGSYSGSAPYNNIVALRGTQSTEEAIYDIADWTLKPCILPYSGGKVYGNVCTDLYDFYAYNNFGIVTSLADSFKAAVRTLDPSRTDWYIAAHSLGGPMVMLGALDSVVSGSYRNPAVRPKVYTFASLHVGDINYVKALNAVGIKEIYRVANLADWVPSFLGPTSDAPGYVHAGLECSFLWQTGGDWANHSLVNVYLKTLASYPNVIRFGPRSYPQ